MSPEPYQPTAARRAFRVITMGMIIPGLVLIIVAGAKHYAMLSIGIIPLTYSFLFGLIESRREKGIPKTLAAFADVIGALMYLGACIPIWVGGARLNDWYHGRDVVMLVTYGSCLYLVNM